MLEIEFKEQRIYQYLDVAPDVYERFMRADSYGEFFFAFINKHYRYKRVGGQALEGAPNALAFVTGNANKLRDLKAACDLYGIAVEQLDLPVDEIQSHDPSVIALQKAKQAYKLAARPVVVNDSSWNILALRGFPGGYMSYVAGWLKAEDFLALMANKRDRTIILTDTLVYYDGKHHKAFSRDHFGVMTDTPRGSGVSIAQIVVLQGQDKTIAELEGQDTASIVAKESIWYDFAIWYHMHRKITRKR